MPATFVLPITALIALVPAALAAYRPAPRPDAVFWATLAVAVVGPAAWVATLADHGWRTGFAFALWISIAATGTVYAVLTGLDRAGARVAPLLWPYLIGLGLVALIWGHTPERSLHAAPGGWLWAHIAIALSTYALVGLAAIAALAVAIQEGAIRAKRTTALSRRLPAVADGERFAGRALAVAVVVLGLGLLSGIGLQVAASGEWFRVDHKTVLTIAAFLVILGLLAAHARWGVRGRRGARIVLVAWLLLTLAYPGVKFVTDVLIGG